MNGFMSVVLFYMMLIQSSQGFTAEKGNEIDPLYFGGSFILRNFMGPRITQKTYTGQEGGPFSPDNRYQMTFGPSLYLQFESDKKVINLTPNNFTTVTEKIIDFSEEDTENRPVIQFQSQSNHGQYVYRKTALHWGWE